MSNGMRSCAQGAREVVIALQPDGVLHKKLGLLKKRASTQSPVPKLKPQGKRQDLTLTVLLVGTAFLFVSGVFLLGSAAIAGSFPDHCIQSETRYAYASSFCVSAPQADQFHYEFDSRGIFFPTARQAYEDQVNRMNASSGGVNYAPIEGNCTDVYMYEATYYIAFAYTGMCAVQELFRASTALIAGVRARVPCPEGWGVDPSITANGLPGVCTKRIDTPGSPKSVGAPAACVGNPVNAGSGNKYQVESDYAGLSQTGFSFKRAYNSVGTFPGILIGTNWLLEFDRRIETDIVGFANIYRHDGRLYAFSPSNGGFIAGSTNSDITDRLVELKDTTGIRIGWRYTVAADDSVETYSAAGKLLSIADHSGRTRTLAYDLPAASGGDEDSKTLDTVTDDTGRQLVFTYDANKRIATVTDPAGGVISYGYDAQSNLVSITYPDLRSRTYHYNEPEHTSGVNLPHALTGITDENGDRYATYQYAANGKAISTGHANGADLHTLIYNADGSTTVIDPLGTARTHNFTTILGVVKSTGQTQPGGSGCGPASSATTYDANGNVASRADFKGIKTCYAYDLMRNLETARIEGLAADTTCPANLATYTPVANTAERKILTDWHPSFRLPVKVTEAGRETTLFYDSRGNLYQRSVRDTVTNETRTWLATHTYHPSVPGVLSQKTEDGPRTDVADITTTDYYLPDENCLGGFYGCRGQVRQITNALGHTTQITRYTAHGQPEEIVDPNDLVTALAYDARQRLIQRSVGSELTLYDYDFAGQLKQVVLPSGAVVRYDYDTAHRLTDIWDEDNNRIRYTLDAMGNRIQEDVFDANGTPVATRNRVFDALNRLWQEIGAVNAATGNRPMTTYGYDANGNLKTVQPPGQPATNYQYDALNRLFQTTDALGGVSQYRYDPLDQLREVRDPRNVTTFYDVNALGDQTRVASPDSGTTNKTYDEAGNLKTSTDARGKESTYSYDALNRLTGISFTSGNPIAFSYDQGPGGVGRLTGMADESGTTQWEYDLHGRVTLKSTTVGGVPRNVAYRYDPQGRLEQITYPSGKVLALTWRASKLDALSLDGQPVLADVQYHPFSGPRQWSFGNGRLVSRGYDADNRLVAYPLGNSVRSLAFDDAGRITYISDSNPALSQGIQYDDLDRLTGWATQLYNQGYSYDAGSNRTSARYGAVNYSHSVAPGSNRLQSVAGPTPKAYQHDAAGNVIHDGRTSFAYNDRGRLASVSNAQGTTSYLINGLGQRAVKTGIEGIRFVYDEGGKVLGEYDPGGALLQETLYLGDIPVAVIR